MFKTSTNIEIKYLFQFEAYLYVLDTFYASCLSAFKKVLVKFRLKALKIKSVQIKHL